VTEKIDVAEATVYNTQGIMVRTLSLDDRVFGVPINVAVMHQALKRQLANKRQGTADTKTRAEVSGGDSKPWRQKGTGRARQGSIRAPQWYHGGIVFGPHPRSYVQAMPRKARRLALRSALSSKVAEKQLIIVDELTLPAPKTKEMVALLSRLRVTSSALVVLPEHDEIIERAARNLPTVKTLVARNLNVRDILTYDYLIMPQGAVPIIQQIYGDSGAGGEG